MELKTSPSSTASRQIMVMKLVELSFTARALARFSRVHFPSTSMAMIKSSFRYAAPVPVAPSTRPVYNFQGDGTGRAMRRQATGSRSGDLSACECAQRRRAVVGRPRTRIGSKSLTDFGHGQGRGALPHSRKHSRRMRP